MKTVERETRFADSRVEVIGRSLLCFLGAAILMFLALTIGNDITRAPWWDEGLFADVALTFRNSGHLGSSILTPTGFLRFPEANRYTYWQFPLYLVTLGYWLRAVPATIVGMRMLSTLLGLFYLSAWFILVRALSRNARLAAFVTGTVAFDYALIGTASDARMDMMCAALGMCGLAAYARWRETNWPFAIGVAACFSAGSLFCHPMGLVMNGILAVFVIGDWRKLRWAGLLGLLPYAFGLALCYLYASEAPQIFLAQSKAAGATRTSNVTQILHNILNDAYVRYVGFYFNLLRGIAKLKVLGLVFAAAGSFGLLLDRQTHFRTLRKWLLIWAMVGYLGVAAIDNQALPIYFIYSMPVLTAGASVWAFDSWHERSRSRIVAMFLMACFISSTIGGFGYKIYKNDFRSIYMPTIQVIRQSLPPGGIVMGGAELAFALGFGPQVVDDRYLGYGSSTIPQIFVSNYYYGEMPKSGLHEAWVWSRQKLQQNYRQIFQNSSYVVFLRNDLPLGGANHPDRRASKANFSTLP